MFNELSTDFNICIDTFYILNMTLFKQSRFAVKWAELVNRPVKTFQKITKFPLKPDGKIYI